jgi:hypothetical protein
MLDSDQFLEQERRHLEEEAEALARVKDQVLPPRRYVEPAAVPAATHRDLRKWQASILGLLVVFNAASLFDAIVRTYRRPDEQILLVEADRVQEFQDVDRGTKVYQIKVRSDDFYPRTDQLDPFSFAIANLLGVSALAYTRYRMVKLKRTQGR